MCYMLTYGINKTLAGAVYYICTIHVINCRKSEVYKTLNTTSQEINSRNYWGL